MINIHYLVLHIVYIQNTFWTQSRDDLLALQIHQLYTFYVSRVQIGDAKNFDQRNLDPKKQLCLKIPVWEPKLKNFDQKICPKKIGSKNILFGLIKILTQIILAQIWQKKVGFSKIGPDKCWAQEVQIIWAHIYPLLTNNYVPSLVTIQLMVVKLLQFEDFDLSVR